MIEYGPNNEIDETTIEEPEGVHIVNHDEDPQLPIKRELYATDWQYESKQIIDIVNSEEQHLLLKCINQEVPTNEELYEIEEILGRYRKAIIKTNPEESIENLESNIQLVQDEKQWLELLQKSREQKTKTLTINYPTPSGEIRTVVDVLPLTDSKAIVDTNSNLNPFQDFTDEEVRIYTDYQQKKAQTREEKALAAHLQKRILEKSTENRFDEIIEFLANQTKLHDRPHNVEIMREIYSTMDIVYAILIYNKVETLLDLNIDLDEKRVFRESG